MGARNSEVGVTLMPHTLWFLGSSIVTDILKIYAIFVSVMFLRRQNTTW